MTTPDPEAMLHTAVCQAVALLNVSPLLARCESGSKAHQILRQALSDYADAYMDQPATKDEVRAISRLHARRN